LLSRSPPPPSSARLISERARASRPCVCVCLCVLAGWAATFAFLCCWPRAPRRRQRQRNKVSFAFLHPHRLSELSPMRSSGNSPNRTRLHSPFVKVSEAKTKPALIIIIIIITTTLKRLDRPTTIQENLNSYPIALATRLFFLNFRLERSSTAQPWSGPPPGGVSGQSRPAAAARRGE
jgi:hypothetical protein